MKRVIVIGAGIGGLTCAAVLARAGLDVTVLEAHVYPGGCAGTFYHQGYRFDAGATLAAGFYPDGPMDLVEKMSGSLELVTLPSNPAMIVHLPNGKKISRWTDERRWEEYLTKFGDKTQKFFYWQEQTAKAMWNMALKLPPWPAQSLRHGVKLIRTGASWLREDIRHLNPGLWVDAFRPLAVHLREMPDDLRLFVDGQLLISAQATSTTANALYGASALDLPRRGAVHVRGGMGEIAKALARRVILNGGSVLYRQEVVDLVFRNGNPVAVKTNRGDEFPADLIITNLPPWNILTLLKGNKPSVLKKMPDRPYKGWGAFMVYVGLEDTLIPENFPLHHQVIVREPLGEGNSVFLSLSPEWDDTRAPSGKRAVTISTHTRYDAWWKIHESDRNQYENQKREYTGRLLSAAERVLPGFCQYIHVTLPGTPLSFQRFTRRAWGWVGGFPQINLFQSLPSRIFPNLWMVGDSIFPGQSVTATALGGLRVAGEVLEENRI